MQKHIKKNRIKKIKALKKRCYTEELLHEHITDELLIET